MAELGEATGPVLACCRLDPQYEQYAALGWLFSRPQYWQVTKFNSYIFVSFVILMLIGSALRAQFYRCDRSFSSSPNDSNVLVIFIVEFKFVLIWI
jgi:hypothetical protein